MDTKFTTDAAHLVSSPRSLVECRIVTVDPGNAGANFLDNADCTGCIGGKYPACQTVRSVVSKSNSLLFRLKGLDCNYRSKDFLFTIVISDVQLSK